MTTATAKTATPKDAAYTIARVAIGAMLDGMAPSTVNHQDLGHYADVYIEMTRAFVAGGTDATRKAYATYAAHDRLVAELMAGDPEPRKPQRTRYTVAELYKAEFPDLRFFVPDLMPEGQTFIIARPKIGKSWMALQLGVAGATGGVFLGKPVKPCKVLYLALEDNPRRMRDRLHKMHAPATGDLTIETRWDPFTKGGIKRLTEEVDREGYEIVIVDTLIRAFGGWDVTKDGAKIGDKLAELQEWALDRHILNVIVHHARKGDGDAEGADVVDAGMGLTNILSSADAVLGIFKTRGNPDAVLKRTGREIDEVDTAIRFDTDLFCWQVLGDLESVRNNGTITSIIEAMREYTDLECTTTDIATYTKISAPNVSRALGTMQEKGLVERLDKRGKQVYYRLLCK